MSLRALRLNKRLPAARLSTRAFTLRTAPWCHDPEAPGARRARPAVGAPWAGNTIRRRRSSPYPVPRANTTWSPGHHVVHGPIGTAATAGDEGARGPCACMAGCLSAGNVKCPRFFNFYIIIFDNRIILNSESDFKLRILRIKSELNFS